MRRALRFVAALSGVSAPLFAAAAQGDPARVQRAPAPATSPPRNAPGCPRARPAYGAACAARQRALRCEYPVRDARQSYACVAGAPGHGSFWSRVGQATRYDFSDVLMQGNVHPGPLLPPSLDDASTT